MLVAAKKGNPWPRKLAILQERLGLRTNDELAERLGVAVETIRSWRYRHKIPSDMAKKFIEELLKSNP